MAEPKRLKLVLPELFTELNLDSLGSFAQINRLWPEVLGPENAKRAELVKIDGKTLLVRVTHPGWKEQFIFLKAEIVAKFNKLAQKTIIEDIKFL